MGTNGGRLTKRTVDALAAPERGERVVWDGQLKGFGVRVRASAKPASDQPAHTPKVFILQYRAGKGRKAPLRKVVIGKHGSPWTVDQARDKARRLLGEVARGADPAIEAREARQAATVKELAEKFLAEHARPKLRARTTEEYARLIRLHIVPVLGNRRVIDVSQADVARLHHAMRETPRAANHALAVLSKMISLAILWSMKPHGENPVRGHRKFHEISRERFLDDEEIRRLGAALAAYEGSPYAVAAIRLLLLTGARRGEILNLRWDQIDFERGEARLQESKTGAKTIMLPPPALTILSRLSRIEGNPFVIVGDKPGAALVNLKRPWQVIREAARLDDVRLHDLRHTFAAMAVSTGHSLPVIGHLLGHSQPATTQRYAHVAASPAAAAAESVASRISAALNGAPAAEIIPLRGSKRPGG